MPPGENATPEERRAFYSSIGCPAKAEEYGVPAVALPESLPLDTNLIGTLQKVAWENGIPKGQWDKLATGFLEYQKASYQTFQQQAEANSQKALNELRLEWGPAAESKFGEAGEAFLELFGNDKKTAGEMADLMLMDGTRLGDHPKLIRALAQLYAKGMSEGAPLSGARTPRARVLSPEEADRELNRLMADEGWKKAYQNADHPEHKEAVERRSALYAMKYPTRQAAG